jgi:riboflavin kinase/FMN adenylyltransferase
MFKKMKLIKGLKGLRKKYKNVVLTIGMFDGVHRAHQNIIKQVIYQARKIKGTSMVLTFDPHPLKLLKGYTDVPLITSCAHRIELIRQLNVDVCILLDFNKQFSKISAKKFIQDILINTLRIKYLIIGRGFRFGRQREGTFSLLRSLSKNSNFTARRISPIKIRGKIISSSKIRSLIQKGRIEQANRFLGRSFSLLGKVKKGSAQGRILGYPTANIEPQEKLIPARGVYVVTVKIKSDILPGILNIGRRPTFWSKKRSSVTIEVHIFNFCKKIYGRNIEIFFVKRIRSEKKFVSHQALLAQIKKDERMAKSILKARKI